MYGDVGGVFKQGTADEVATQQDINTRKGVERIIRYAFDYARANGFDRVAMADKSNALTHAGSLWQRVWRQVGEESPEIAKRHF